MKTLSSSGATQACALALICSLFTPQARAAEVTVSNGGYMQCRAGDKTLVLPLKHTAVDAEVAGVVASVQVTQHFENPSKKPIEAVYVFPLPERAAVTSMTIRVGQRLIKGVIKKRVAARQIYQQAKARGQTAALLEQERPNIFTQSVANILPGDKIKVTLRYVEQLTPRENLYSFTFPMVVGPRYIGGGLLTGGAKGGGWGKDTSRIPDASRITPPLLGKGLRPGRDLSLRLRLNSPKPIKHLRVVTHQAKVTTNAGGSTVTLDPQDAIPNKDFVVRYQLAGVQPTVTLLTHRDKRGGHFLLMIQPKAKMAPRDIAPREYIFVIDTSGSQSGFPLRQSKAAVRRCLDNVKAGDTFQLVQFESGVSTFARRAVPATAANVQAARTWLRRLRGGGGTELIPALRAALGAPKDRDRARIVLFMTDGYIGYEREVLRYLREHGAGTNLFPMGVGSSVNRHLIEGMARIGGGRPFYLLNADKPAAAVERVFSTISRPALTDIKIHWGQLDVADLTPHALPDLFGEQPVIVAGRFGKGGSGEVIVRGRLAGRAFEQRVKVTLPAHHTGTNRAIAALWARRQIMDWADAERVEPETHEEMERRITALALRYSLMSTYTSLVAVDHVVRNKGGAQGTVPVPVPLPQGVSEKAAPPSAYISSGESGSMGLGGLGLSGQGYGGGGTGSGTIGIGQLGSIGHGGAGGSGYGYGRGAGLKARRASSPQIRTGKVMVKGSLDANIIRRIIRRHINEVRYCYQKQLTTHPKLTGRVVLRFFINNGKVFKPEIRSTTLNNKAVEQCLMKAVVRWQFPATPGMVQISYPFHFKPGQ